MFCTRCQAPLPADAAFCAKCGKAVGSISLQSAKASRSSNVWFAVGIAVVFIFLVGRFITPLSSGSTPAASVSKMHTITYRITGTALTTDIHYNNAENGTTHDPAMPSPWHKDIEMRSGAVAYISAQNNHTSGDVTCEILLDGVVVKSSHSDGDYVIATCDGRVP